MQKSFSNLRFSEFRDTLSDIPAKLRHFVAVKINGKTLERDRRNTDEQVYNDRTYGPNYNGIGSLSCASTVSKSSLNEPVIYNSGAESEYNSSILSDSCSVVQPPPPPPKSYQSKKKQKVPAIAYNFDEDNNYHNNQDTNYYFDNNEEEDEDFEEELRSSRHFKRSNAPPKVVYNKYTNKLKYQKQRDNTRI